MCFGEAILRRVAVRAAKPIASAALSEPLPALPDFLFEYDDSDRVIQKITTTSGKKIGYFIWRYVFNEKGLKTKEALFNKDKELQARIDYTYN